MGWGCAATTIDRIASHRWFRNGWMIDRDVPLEQMTASWVELLCDHPREGLSR